MTKARIHKAAWAMTALMLAAPLGAAAAGNPWDERPAGLTEADVERFLHGWVPRVADEAWMEAYLAAPGIPQEVAAEGFHALDSEGQRYLVGRLHGALLAQVPSYRDHFAALPDAERPVAEEEAQRNLFLAIFAKEELKAAFRSSNPEPPAAPAKPLEVAVPRPEALPPLAPALPAPPELPATPTPMHLAVDQLGPGALSDAEPKVRLVMQNLIPKLEAAPAEPSTDLHRGPVNTAYGVVNGLLYAACAFSAKQPGQCSPWVPLGTPIPLDATGDPVPDVVAQLLPLVDLAYPLGFGLRLVVTRDNPLGALPALVVFGFHIPETNKRVWIWFDGLQSNLSTQTQVQLAVKNLAELAAGHANITLNIGHIWAPSDLQAWNLGFLIQTIQDGILAPPTGDAIVGVLYFDALPGFTADLDIDVEAKLAKWSGSAPLKAFYGFAYVPTSEGRWWWAHLYLERIPAKWELSWSGGRSFFRPEGTLGLAWGLLTNHGSVTWFGAVPHASIVHDRNTGDLDLAFFLYDVKLLDYEDLADGFRADVRMGGQPFFYLHGRFVNGVERAAGAIYVIPPPSSLQVEQRDQVFRYTSDANFDLFGWVEAGNMGALENTPAAPLVHGMSVTDGAGCSEGVCGTAIKGFLYLTGLPTQLTADLAKREFDVKNFRPKVPQVVLFADLDDIVTRRLLLIAIQDGIPTDGIDYHFGPVNERLAGGGREVTAAYTASKPMGQLYVHLERGNFVAVVIVSNIPASMSFAANFGSRTNTYSASLSEPIRSVLVVLRRSGAVDWEAHIGLTDIPTSVAFAIGSVQGTDSDGNRVEMKGLSYTASADTLDVGIAVQASLWGGDLRARLGLGIVNLGRQTSIGLDGRTLVVSSTPKTERFEVHFWAEWVLMKSIEKSIGGSSLKLVGTGHAGLNPVFVDDLAFVLKNFSSVTAELGLATVVSGTYEMLQVHWNQMGAVIDIEGKVEFVIKVAGLSFDFTVASFTFHQTLTIDIAWHVMGDHAFVWKSFGTGIPCGWRKSYDVIVEVQPHPHAKSTNGFVLGSPAEGGSWVVVPDPWDWVHDDIVMFVAAILVGDVSIDIDCD